jgi:hypothetical protein
MRHAQVTDENKAVEILKGEATKYVYIKTRRINSNKV